MRVALPAVLTLNGGYVDAAGFLAFKGLFTAHVTGNYITLASALVFGTSGVRAKILAVVIGCASGAALYTWVDVWCFLTPPICGLIAAFLAESTPASGTVNDER